MIHLAFSSSQESRRVAFSTKIPAAASDSAISGFGLLYSALLPRCIWYKCSAIHKTFWLAPVFKINDSWVQHSQGARVKVGSSFEQGPECSRVVLLCLCCFAVNHGRRRLTYSQEHNFIYFQDLRTKGMKATLWAKFRAALMAPLSRLAHDLGKKDVLNIKINPNLLCIWNTCLFCWSSAGAGVDGRKNLRKALCSSSFFFLKFFFIIMTFLFIINLADTLNHKINCSS